MTKGMKQQTRINVSLVLFVMSFGGCYTVILHGFRTLGFRFKISWMTVYFLGLSTYETYVWKTDVSCVLMVCAVSPGSKATTRSFRVVFECEVRGHSMPDMTFRSLVPFVIRKSSGSLGFQRSTEAMKALGPCALGVGEGERLRFGFLCPSESHVSEYLQILSHHIEKNRK